MGITLLCSSIMVRMEAGELIYAKSSGLLNLHWTLYFFSAYA
jgi:hypothetical protein